MEFFNLIKKNVTKLNQNEKALLEYLFVLKENLKNHTIRDIAAKNFTSPNAIVRLCKKLGFSGYVEFRESYCNAISWEKSMIKLTSLDEQLVKTKQLINPEVLHHVLKKMYISEKIAIFAVGLSRTIAEDLYLKLISIGKNCQFFVDPHVMHFNAKTLNENDLVFSISASGLSDNPIYATTISKAAGATTVSITGFSNNPLAELTHYQFYGMIREIYIDGIDVSGRLGLNYIVDYIFTEYLKAYVL
ncbi:MAG: MurR/RpiR family transcriptional regulator [Defluviitaleaceae bacterium]|nr:MurR/RpiR family transcriptional regulator [Defluviitaleaceae bacterium]